mmetsp:Transcript_28687/g.66935  ORF Transcript_28687/g.66935 Transcript_28687/m.66935 type:complete len:212 (-) Transcript_28687:24-659(-)
MTLSVERASPCARGPLQGDVSSNAIHAGPCVSSALVISEVEALLGIARGGVARGSDEACAASLLAPRGSGGSGAPRRAAALGHVRNVDASAPASIPSDASAAASPPSAAPSNGSSLSKPNGFSLSTPPALGHASNVGVWSLLLTPPALGLASTGAVQSSLDGGVHSSLCTPAACGHAARSGSASRPTLPSLPASPRCTENQWRSSRRHSSR